MSEHFDPEKPFFRSIEDDQGNWRREYFGFEDLDKVWNGEDLDEEADEKDEQ